MKHLKQFLLMAMLLFTLAPLQVSAKENIDVKEILWGHIKDSYEWHITSSSTAAPPAFSRTLAFFSWWLLVT